MLFGLLGFCLFIFRHKFSPNFFSILLGLIPIMVVSFCSGILNRTYDFEFLFWGISHIVIFFSAYFISVFMLKEGRELSLSFMFRCFIIVVFIQSVIASLMFISEGFNAAILSITRFSDLERTFIERSFGARLMGWGTSAFGAGVVHGLSLLCMTYLLLKREVKHVCVFAGIFVFILLIGVLLARTTLLGLCVSFFFLFIWEWRIIAIYKTKIKWILWIISMLLLGVLLLFSILDEDILMWAFELFVNFVDSGEVSTRSTEIMLDMYVFPTDIKTYIIGDGLFSIGGDEYYMGTDIGYLRLLYYGGIPLVVAFFCYPFFIIKRICKLDVDPLLKGLLNIMLLYLLLLNLKGLADFNFVLVLIYVVVYYCSSSKGVTSTTVIES
jgi:hypothetical protein